MANSTMSAHSLFQSTLPVRGATVAAMTVENELDISIHAPRAGSDSMCRVLPSVSMKFQSTLPVRGATRVQPPHDGRGHAISIHAPRAGSDPLQRLNRQGTRTFQSTLPVRGATVQLRTPTLHLPRISIHAPRAGSDTRWFCRSRSGAHFNPRSPCGERRLQPERAHRHQGHFNPRSPCGERQGFASHSISFSIFQSTLPVRGATRTHSRAMSGRYFNPRSPCGERLRSCASHSPRFLFQSTLPVRGATIPIRSGIPFLFISIHAPRAGSDPSQRRPSAIAQLFQSTLPVRGATAIYCAFASSKRNIYSISYSKHCERYKRQTSFNRIRCESLWNFLRASDSHS